MNQFTEQKDTTTLPAYTDLHQEVANMRQGVMVSAGELPDILIQKIAQISKALHLVTKHVDKNDPICESLRKSSVDLVINFYDLLAVDRQVSLQEQKCDLLLHNLYKAGSLIQLAQVSQCISVQNSLIIEREVLKLIQLVTSFKKTLVQPREIYKQVEHTVITELFSSTKSYKEDVQKEPVSNVSENIQQEQPKPKMVISVVQNQNKEKVVVPPKPTLSTDSVKSFAPNQLVERDNDGIRRQALITKLVRDKQSVTIKDITTILPHVSEKTLQRDLTSLSEKGLVRKEGERRWAKYLAI